MTAYAPIDAIFNDSIGYTRAVPAIGVPAKDYTDYTARGGLILLTGFISIIMAVGAIFWFGSKGEDDEKE